MPETSERDRQAMMAALYGLGWPAEAIADLTGGHAAAIAAMIRANFPAIWADHDKAPTVAKLEEAVAEIRNFFQGIWPPPE